MSGSEPGRRGPRGRQQGSEESNQPESGSRPSDGGRVVRTYPKEACGQESAEHERGRHQHVLARTVEIEIVELLDTAARPHQRRLMQDYLGMTRQQKFQENKLWTCGFKFSRALADTYVGCLRQYQRGASGAAAVKKQVPLFVARGMRALAFQVKWTMLRYGPFDARLWSSIGELYGYAEKSGFAQTEITLYATTRTTSTVELEYLKVMMLWASSADVLPPLRQEIAERAVGHFVKWSERPIMEKTYCTRRC